MPATLEEVKQLIRAGFEGADVDGVTEDTTNHRISGVIVWPDFKELDMRQRDRLIMERVRGKLRLRGLNVDLLIPIAPGEKL